MLFYPVILLWVLLNMSPNLLQGLRALDLNYGPLDRSRSMDWNVVHCPRRFACFFCGRRFKRKDHRIEHERIHTGERPFVCLECGRGFIQKHQLVSHSKRIHPVSESNLLLPPATAYKRSRLDH